MHVRNARCASRRPRMSRLARIIGEIMVSRHTRAWSLVALTVATLLFLLGALVARELKGVERPVRLYRLRPAAAG